MNILHLPVELQTDILLLLPIFDQVSASLTCVLWWDIFASPHCLRARYPASNYEDIPPVHSLLGGAIIHGQFAESCLRCVVRTKEWAISKYDIGPYGEDGFRRTDDWRPSLFKDRTDIGKCAFLDEPILSPFIGENFSLELEQEGFIDKFRANDDDEWFKNNDIFLTCFSKQDGKYECPLLDIAAVLPKRRPSVEAYSTLVVKRLNLTPDLTIRQMAEAIVQKVRSVIDRKLAAKLPETIRLVFVLNKEVYVAGYSLHWGLHCSLFYATRNEAPELYEDEEPEPSEKS